MSNTDILQQLSLDSSKFIKNNLSDIKKLSPQQQKHIGGLFMDFKDGLDSISENTDSVNEAYWDQKRNDTVRKTMPGYVGVKFAKVASEEDLDLMIRLKQANSEQANAMLPNIKSMDYLYKKYKISSKKGIEQ
jgi:hypothetical protein